MPCTPCRGWDLLDLLRHMDDSLAALTEAAEIGYVDLVPVRGDALDGLVERLLEPRETPGVTVVCSQGGAIPSVLMALGVQGADVGGALWPPSSKGSVWVLGGRPGALLADYYRDFAPDPDGR